ncbi:MAG: dat 1 [Acidobacteria bacterium]|nr:dat 1 [Acidobacteriota bacterium]
MGATIYVNGRITGEHDAVVPVLDHGFLFGEGVYEVMRTYRRRPFLYRRHMDRMRRSAAMIDLAVPFTDEYLLDEIRKTAERFYAEQGAAGDAMEMYVRVLLTRGVGAITYDVRACPAQTVVIIVKPQVDPPPEAYEQGVQVILVPVVRNHPGSINPLIKSNNLLNNALAWQHAKRQGGFEAIMRNYRGEISECSQSNLFVIKDGAAATPPLEAGLLAGITRAFVFECGESAGVPVREATLHDEDLFGADEVFLTSTTREIVPIVQIGDRTVGAGQPGPVTRTLLAEFRRRIPEGL